MLIISKLDLSLYFEVESAFEKTQVIVCDIFFSIIVKYLQIVSHGPGSVLGAWNVSMNKTKTCPYGAYTVEDRVMAKEKTNTI